MEIVNIDDDYRWNFDGVEILVYTGLWIESGLHEIGVVLLDGICVRLMKVWDHSRMLPNALEIFLRYHVLLGSIVELVIGYFGS
jgi:hypothetical protein